VNRALSFGLAALQALIILSSAVGVILVPLTLAWLLEGNGSVGWIVALQVAGYAVLLSVGVPIQIGEGEIVGIAFDTFALSFLPLGLTLVMALMIIRIGHRISAASSLWPAWLGGALTFGAASYGLSLVVANPSVILGEWDPLFRPALFFALLLFVSSVSGKRFELVSGSNQVEAAERIWIRERVGNFIAKLHWTISTSALPALRIGTSVIVFLLLASSLLIMVALVIGWVEVLRLYQSLSLSFLGGLMVTLGQLAILPNLIIFGMAWISGAGFSIGAGSYVSPLATQLGPLPALPIFAALPTGGFERGIVFAIVPVVAAIIATLLARKSTEKMRWEFATSFSAAAVLAGFSALVASLLAFALALLASGSLGPGRFVEVGINPPLIAMVIFVEVLIPVFSVSLVVLRPQGAERK
jgi:hypothetical protein